MKKTLQSLAVLTFFIISSCTKEIKETNPVADAGAASSPGNSISEQASQNNFVPNELLVKFKKGSSETVRSQAFAKIGGSVSERILTKAMQSAGDNEGLYLIRTPLAVFEAVSKIKGVEIEFAEPNYIYTHSATSNDPYYTNGSLWGMYGSSTSPANQFGSQAGTAWAAGKIGSTAVFIGIIDEGYMFTHPDLAANKGVNPGETANNGIDDDLNGYIDDVEGWDFANNDKTVFDGAGDDHGTHVAGTIGAKGGNGAGVAGVCWNVKLLNAKFLGSQGGTLANAVKSVDYFTNLKKKGLNIVATNNSWGGGGFSQALFDAIERANTAGILFIAAAGNDGTNNDATASYPSGYTNSNIIAVAAIGSNGSMPTWSNWGATTVDIGAPGVGIWSTIPKSVKGKVTATYASYSGTSMATPHVTGGAALYASSNTGATAAQIKAAIINSAVPTASLAGKCVTGGRLNVSGF